MILLYYYSVLALALGLWFSHLLFVERGFEVTWSGACAVVLMGVFWPLVFMAALLRALDRRESEQ